MRQLLNFLNNKLNKFLLIAIFLFLPFLVQALCPVCVILAAGGVGLSRWLGIDDTISGLWIGGVVMSIVIWTIEELDKRKIKFLFRKPLVLILWYFLAFWPLQEYGLIGHPENKIFGHDKLVFGIIIGSIVIVIGVLFHEFLKKKNKGKSFFPFQKVVVPIFSLLILSLIFYFLTS